MQEEEKEEKKTMTLAEQYKPDIERVHLRNDARMEEAKAKRIQRSCLVCELGRDPMSEEVTEWNKRLAAGETAKAVAVEMAAKAQEAAPVGVTAEGEVAGGRKRRGKKSRKSRKGKKPRKGKKSRKNKRRTKRR